MEKTQTNNTAYCKQGVANELEDADEDEEHSILAPGYSVYLCGGCMSLLPPCSPGFVCTRLERGSSLASIFPNLEVDEYSGRSGK